jgi:O-methyltransferase
VEKQLSELITSSMNAPDPYLELLKRCLTAEIYDESAWQIDNGHRSRMGLFRRLRQIVLRTMARRGYLLVRPHRFNPVSRDEGVDWPLFGYSMIGMQRMHNLEKCMRTVLAEKIPGDFIETGAWRGGSTIFMRAVLQRFGITDRKVWVADSFQGLPRPTHAEDCTDARYDLSECDYLKVSLEQVKANFAKFDLLDDQVQFLKGWFKDTLPTAPINQLAVLRLDGDMYESTMDALNSLFHKVSPGGFVIVDDYSAWPGCRAAVDEFRRKNQLPGEVVSIDKTGVFWRVPVDRQRAAA